jgi:hypothetical protein
MSHLELVRALDLPVDISRLPDPRVGQPVGVGGGGCGAVWRLLGPQMSRHGASSMPGHHMDGRTDGRTVSSSRLPCNCGHSCVGATAPKCR